MKNETSNKIQPEITEQEKRFLDLLAEIMANKLLNEESVAPAVGGKAKLFSLF